MPSDHKQHKKKTQSTNEVPSRNMEWEIKPFQTQLSSKPYVLLSVC